MPIEPRMSDLIQADIDGEIADGDKAELDAFLAQSEAGRALYGEFESLIAVLDEMEDVEVPAHLKHVVMNMVPAAEPQRPDRPGFMRRMFAAPALGYVGTFAAGAILAIALVNSSEVSTTAFDDMTGLVGTIADVEKIGKTHSSVSIDKSEVAGTVTLRQTGTLLILDFDLAAQHAVEIHARYADKSIWFNGFAQLESPGTSIDVEMGLVKLEMHGKRRYAVFLNNPGNHNALIEMDFMEGGRLIHATSLGFEQ